MSVTEQDGLQLVCKKHAEYSVIKASGQLDVGSGSFFEQTLLELMHTDRIATVIDMGGISYLSSAGLRSLLLMAKQSKSTGTHLLFCNLSAVASDIFEVSGFNVLLPIYEDSKAAVSAIGNFE